MDKENRNPLLAGLINALLPGSIHWYVNKDRGRFIKAFLVGVAAYVVAIWAGNTIQRSSGDALPPGIFIIGLVMIVVVVLFVGGYKVARERRSEMDDATMYNAKRIVAHESDENKYTKIQEMRDEGLISEQEYDEKNAKVAAQKK